MQNNCIVMTVIIYIATSGHKITSIHYFSSQAPVTSNNGQHAPEQTLCHTTQDKNRTDMDRIEHHVYEWYNMQNAENKVKTKAEHGTDSPQSKAHSSTCEIKADVTLVIYHRHHAPVRLNYYRTVLAIQRWATAGLVCNSNGRINEISGVIHRRLAFLRLVREQVMCQRHEPKVLAQWIPALKERWLSGAPVYTNTSMLPLPTYITNALWR